MLFGIYNNPPILKFISPRQGRGVSGRTDIQFEARDEDGDSLNDVVLSYAAPGSSEFVTLVRNPSSDSVVWDVSSLKDASGYILKFVASDGITRTETTNNVFVDNTSPTVTLEPLKETVFRRDFVIRASGSAEDGLSGIEFVEYSVDGEHWFKALLTKGYLSAKAAFKISHSFALPDGKYTLSVRALDAAGNISKVVSQKITIDTAPPRVGSFLVSAGPLALAPTGSSLEVPLGARLHLAVSLERDTKDASVEIGAASSTLVYDGSTGTWGFDFVPSAPGAFKVTVTARDVHNNVTEKKQIASLVVVPRPRIEVKDTIGSQQSRDAVPEADISVLVWSEDAQSYVLWSASSYGLTNPVHTSTDGSYELALPRGRYQLSVTKPGFVKLRTSDIVLDHAQFVDYTLFVARREGIRGAIEDLIQKISIF